MFGKKKKEVLSPVTALLLAAGSGSRMNSAIKKQYMEIGTAPVLSYSLVTLNHCPAIDEIILVVASEDIVEAQNLVRDFDAHKVSKIIPGGATRQESVFAGFLEAREESRYILVHDGARPFLDEEDLLAVLKDATQYQAAALGVKSKDTVKITNPQGIVLSTPDRENVYQIQTPQVIERELFARALIHAKETNFVATDDTSLVEALGEPVKITPGNYENMKITTPEDLLFAELLAERREER